MALPKAVGCMLALLLVFYTLEKQGYSPSLTGFFEKWIDTKASHIHVREKRQSSSNSCEYVLQAVIKVSDLERLQILLNNLSFPVMINSTTEVTSIDTTTVCSSNMTEVQCRCEQGFAFSFNNCISHGACDTISGGTCGCINALPANDQYCQPNTSQTETTPAPTPPNDPVDIDLVLDLRIPVSSLPPNFINVFRQTLQTFPFPQVITPSLSVVEVNFTTACFPNSSGGVQCQCEEQYAWPCDSCTIYGVCSNTTGHTCECINALPSDGQFCEPITDVAPCPTTTPVITTTTAMTTTTAAADPVDIDLVLDLRIPVSSLPPNFINIFRQTLQTFSFPQFIPPSLTVVEVNFTTACFPNSSGGVQCQCEEQYAWPCDSCTIYGACSNTTGHTCECINALPSDGQFCEPITNVAPCPTPTPVITTTTAMTTTTTTITTTTTAADPVDIDLVLDLRIPVSSLPPNFINIFRQTLQTFSFPQFIPPSLTVVEVNFTTACFPNSSGGVQCQCEEQYAWPCDSCTIYGACSNTTGHTCECINALPSDGQFCEPITNVSQCPATTPGTTATTEMTTTTPMTTTTTPVTTTTTPMTTTTTPMTTTTTTPMTTTTTPMTTTTTTPMTTTTTPMTTTTTPMTTTTTTTVTTTSPSTPPPATEVRNSSFILDLDFDPSFNDPSSTVYQNANRAIQQQSETHISAPVTASIIAIREGSTIVDYSLRAASLPDAEIEAVQTGIFTQLGEIYTMLFDSPTQLSFNPMEVFFGDRVIVTCGPPPENLNLGTALIAEWRLNDRLIQEDVQHSFSITDGEATLEVSSFFSNDNGRYECRLSANGPSQPRLIFRQRSDGEVTLREIPQITVTPVRIQISCEVGQVVPLRCSVNSPYEVEFRGVPAEDTSVADNTITYEFQIPDCDLLERTFTCQEKSNTRFSREIRLELPTENFFCVNDAVFGDGLLNDEAVGPCDSDSVGEIIAFCNASREWQVRRDSCVLLPVQNLLEQSQSLNNNSLPGFLEQLSNITQNFNTEVVASPATITAVVEILDNVANASLSIPINRILMEDVLLTAGVLTTNDARQSWSFLNVNDTSDESTARTTTSQTESVSSTLLQSLETITRSLTDDSFDISTPSILLNKTTFTDTFDADLNSSVEIDVTESGGGRSSITVLTFASLNNTLPPRDEANSSVNVINGRVVLVQSNGTINNVSFTFDVLNNTLSNPQCVFWNFSLFDSLGGWDDEGCMPTNSTNGTITCTCNHLTSFSILMSPFSPVDPVLDAITYAGVAVSMASLVICLIIEAVIWRKIRRNTTSYLRHVSVVNIAVSLLIADIWFIIGAAISDLQVTNTDACHTATFFIHLFYLALFFWMLASALLLFYRTVNVFDGGLSKKSMLAIGFSLGYGAPLIIAVITIAVTAPREEYIRQSGACWLNWDESKALLAFVIPALLIVVINLIILLVVIYKMLRRRAVGDAAQAAERHVLLVILRCLAVLTPFFGLTWGLGVGTITPPYNRDAHISFAFFNSLQGFFILLFGTLLDKKVRSEIAIKSQISTSGTRSTSAGNSSSSGLGIWRKLKRGRDGYNMSTSDSGASQSFTDT